MPKLTRIQQNRKRLAILRFAEKNNLVIDPASGFEGRFQDFLSFGFCPCDPTKMRKACPCKQALAEVKEKGYCLCKMFWKDIGTFKKIYKETDEKATSSKNGTLPRGRGGKRT